MSAVLDQFKSVGKRNSEPQKMVRALVVMSAQLKELSPFSIQVKQAFKSEASKRDMERIGIYLLDLVGMLQKSNDALKEENTALKDILKQNNIDAFTAPEPEVAPTEVAGVTTSANDEKAFG